jgi:DNA-binding transcriptional LysR family regulator
VPTSIDELAEHDCIVSVRANGVTEHWPLREGGVFTVDRPKLAANASGLIRIGALQGLGIALIGQSLVRADVSQGALVPVLEGRVGQVMPVSLVYATGSKLSPKIRCFVDFASAWVERLGTGPALPGPSVAVE